MPILAHESVSDEALDEAAKKLDRLLGHAPEIEANLNALSVQLHVIGKDQAVTDLPEYRHMKGKPFAGKQTMDERGRGYGGRECSCSEENLLKLPSDRYRDHRDICSHGFSHGIFGFGLSPEIRELWVDCYHKAMAAGRWKGMYASTNADEYFAELTMWYVGSRGDYGKLDPRPKPGPQWLQSYDPDAYQLLDAIYTGRMKPEEIVATTLKPLPSGHRQRASSNRPTARSRRSSLSTGRTSRYTCSGSIFRAPARTTASSNRAPPAAIARTPRTPGCWKKKAASSSASMSPGAR